MVGTPVTLKDAFFQDPESYLADGGGDGLLRHLTNDLSNSLDVHIVDDLRNFLFGPSAVWIWPRSTCSVGGIWAWERSTRRGWHWG